MTDVQGAVLYFQQTTAVEAAAAAGGVVEKAEKSVQGISKQGALYWKPSLIDGKVCQLAKLLLCSPFGL